MGRPTKNMARFYMLMGGVAAISISGALPTASAATAYSAGPLTLTGAAGGGAWALGSGAPSWLTLDAGTGVFGGTPTFSVGIVFGQLMQAAVLGQAYSNPALDLYNEVGGGVWALGSGAPSWLTIDAGTGVFGGTPT